MSRVRFQKYSFVLLQLLVMTFLLKYGLVNFANRSPGLLRSMRLAWKIQKFNAKMRRQSGRINRRN